MSDSAVDTATQLVNNDRQRWVGYLITPILWLCLAGFLGVVVNHLQKKTISSIYIETRNLDAEEIRQLQKELQPFDNHSFFGVRLNEVDTKIQALSWVSDSRVYRDWHKGVVVEVTPRQAIANFGSSQLIDVNGVVFTPANPSLVDNPKLVKLYATDNNTKLVMQKTQKLNMWFAPTGLVVEDVILTPRQTWLVRFNSGLRVMADFEKVDERLYELSQLVTNHQLPIALTDIATIDLRYKNGFSITPKYTPKPQ